MLWHRMAAILLLCWLAAPLSAQDDVSAQQVSFQKEKTHLLIILDCSKSMWDYWQSDAKIKVTQQVLLHFIDSVSRQQDIDIALRVFGHLNKDSYGTRLEVPFEEDNFYKLQSKIKTLVPNGGCTASDALGSSLSDFSKLQSERNIILIITDGMDDCDGEICNVARQVQLSGVIVQTFILGIGNPNDFQHNLDCAGKFTYLPSEERYTEALYDVFRQADQTAKVVVKIVDSNGELYETSFPIAFYDAQTGVVKYTTLYSNGYSSDIDTLTVDPLVNYNVSIFTKPPIFLKDKHFSTDSPNEIVLNVEQGEMRVRFDGKRTTYNVPSYPIQVRQHGKDEVVATMQIGERIAFQKGFYDVELLSVPPVLVEDVEIRSAATTDLALPTPGLLSLYKPKVITSGALFAVRDGVLQWVCDLNESSVSERMLLSPGEYQVVLKPRKATNFGSVRTLRFSIQSGQQTSVNF